MRGKIYDGYATKPGRKIAFEVGPCKSKQAAYNEAKKAYPDWTVHVTGYHLTGKRVKI